jgi:hypothetical protein
MKRGPARKVLDGKNEDPDGLIHEIAVASREADRIRLSEGETTALTWGMS